MAVRYAVFLPSVWLLVFGERVQPDLIYKIHQPGVKLALQRAFNIQTFQKVAD